MIDREKVIEELERLSEWFFLQYQVVYDGDAPNYYDAYKTVDDALALLKEQEAQLVLNIGEQISCKSGSCPKCGKMLNTTCNKRYCGDCGQAVKWNDSF